MDKAESVPTKAEGPARRVRPTRKWHFGNVHKDESLSGQVVKVALVPNGLLTGSAADSAQEIAETVETEKLTKARISQAWQIATKPVQQILMQGFMMYMSGSTINIFSIMITSMAFINPLTAIANVNSTFARLDDGKIDLTVQKLAFIGVQLLGLLLAMWKCGTMGLLPLTSADWASYIVLRKAMEAAGVGTPIDVA